MVARGLLALAVVLSQFSAASSGANRRLQETPEQNPEPAPPPPPPPTTTYPNIELSFYSDASCSTAGGAMVGVTPVSRATVATSGACSPLWVWTGERPVVVAHLTGAFSASGSFDFTAYEADDTGCAGVIRDTGAMQTDGSCCASASCRSIANFGKTSAYVVGLPAETCDARQYRAVAAAGGFECVACSTCNTQAGLEEADACGLVDTLCQCAPGLYGDSTVCLSEDALPECDVAKLVHYVEGVKRNCAGGTCDWTASDAPWTSRWSASALLENFAACETVAAIVAPETRLADDCAAVNPTTA